MKKQYLVASFIVSSLLVPVLASAATADEIRSQIQSLLSQITALQAQLNNLTSNTSTAVSTSSNSCPNLYRALSRGSRGSDVISLQQFLIAQGLLSGDSATGYFGSMTELAVQRWQAQNSIVSSGSAVSTGYGVVGVRTRATISTKCTTTSSPVQPSTSFSASPMSGQAPLGVTFTTNVSGASVNFGDGTSAPVESNCFYGSSGCTIGSYSTYHSYQSPGTYTAALSHAGSCSSGYCAQAASATITVTGGQTVTPPAITSLQPAAGSVGTTVTINGSGFAASNSIYLNDTFVETQSNSNGSIPTSITFVIPVGFGEICSSGGTGCSAKIVNPGSYTTISVKNANGTSNSITFTVTGGQTITLPTISSLSPTSGPVSFTNVTITGTGFTATGNDVHFGSVGGIKNVSSNGTSLTFTVPLAVTACDFSADPQSCTTAQMINIGDYQVYVQNANGTSNSTTFTVTGGQTI